MHPLTRWRKKNKLSLHAVARKLDTTATYVSEIEKLKKTPSLGFAQRIAVATKGEVTATDLGRFITKCARAIHV